MRRELFREVRIIRVENGYCLGNSDKRYDCPPTSYVFETFENLVAWMRENLEGAQ